ncbi:hypothetical protein BJ138DRAFT_1167082 [Hygrophoropsis aurantiaca]|uniref:Uncharacterized protein n=1 Tax=Hygrophoropsis aurantiaca TaxID=72124 RepID=A0ACB7ZSG6_9AGAM|nr:hypothetical protein BJ138DRAFT_1167082 [Hygrophoropsis aurantiaca]
MKTLRLFQRLCGENASKGVFFVATHWSAASSEAKQTHEFKSEREIEEEREDELKKRFFSSMLGHGATCERFLRTHESAWAIVDLIINKGAPVETLQIQEELVDLRIPLRKTSAGASLHGELGEKFDNQDMQRLKQSLGEEEYRELKKILKNSSALLQVPFHIKLMKRFGLGS